MVAYQLFAVAWQVVYDGYLNHGVCAGLLFHCGAGCVDEYLGGEGGVVDAHVELEVLVVGGAADAFACHVDAVTYIVEGIDAFYGEYVCFVAGKVWVGFDGCCDFGDVCSVFEFYVYHAAVYALPEGYGH